MQNKLARSLGNSFFKRASLFWFGRRLWINKIFETGVSRIEQQVKKFFPAIIIVLILVKLLQTLFICLWRNERAS
jgi:hypothetical protein